MEMIKIKITPAQDLVIREIFLPGCVFSRNGRGPIFDVNDRVTLEMRFTSRYWSFEADKADQVVARLGEAVRRYEGRGNHKAVIAKRVLEKIKL